MRYNSSKRNPCAGLDGQGSAQRWRSPCSTSLPQSKSETFGRRLAAKTPTGVGSGWGVASALGTVAFVIVGGIFMPIACVGSWSMGQFRRDFVSATVVTTRPVSTPPIFGLERNKKTLPTATARGERRDTIPVARGDHADNQRLKNFESGTQRHSRSLNDAINDTRHVCCKGGKRKPPDPMHQIRGFRDTSLSPRWPRLPGAT
jgi:hypothetical protein